MTRTRIEIKNEFWETKMRTDEFLERMRVDASGKKMQTQLPGEQGYFRNWILSAISRTGAGVGKRRVRKGHCARRKWKMPASVLNPKNGAAKLRDARAGKDNRVRR